MYLPLLWRSQIPTSFYSAGAAMAATRPTSLPTSSLRPDDQSLEDPNDSHAPRPSVTPSRPHDADDDGGGSSDVHSEGRARGAGDTNDASIATTLATSRLRGEQRSLRHGLRLGSPNISPNISVPRGEWRLYEDRPGKPGWISSGPNGSTITFDVTFGARPRLTLSWMLGYAGLGRVAVGFVGARHAGKFKVIEGMREDGVRVSQAAVLDMDVGHLNHGSRLDLPYGIAGWGIKPHANERFQVQLLCEPNTMHCGKFKLLGIRAC